MRNVGCRDLDGRKATLEGCVLLDILAVLVKSRGADGLELTAREHRLEDARGVDRTFGRTCADQRVQLIDEQDDVAARADLLEHLLQALLEITAVAAAGDESTEVKGVELLVLEGLGHLALDDVLCKAFDDGGLADAGLADEHGVVLGATRQHLHDALDLFLAADDRIKLALARSGSEIAAELVEHERCRRSALGRSARGGRLLARVSGEELDDLLAHAIEVGAELDEHLSGNTLALADESQQDVLGADVVVAQLQRFAQGQFEHLLGARSEGNVSAGRLLALANDLLDLLAHGLKRNAQTFERLGGDAFALMDEAEQDVLGADVVVIEHARLFLREHHNPASPVGKPLEHASLRPSA